MIPIIALFLLGGAIWFLRRKSSSDISLVEEETPTPADTPAATAGWKTRLVPIREWWKKHPNFGDVVIPTTLSYFGILLMIYILWPTWVWAKLWADWGRVLIYHALFIWMIWCIHANKVWMARTAKLLGILAWAGLLTTTLGWTPWIGETYWINRWANETKVAETTRIVAQTPVMEYEVTAPVKGWLRIPTLHGETIRPEPPGIRFRGENLKQDEDRGDGKTPHSLTTHWVEIQSRTGKPVKVTVLP